MTNNEALVVIRSEAIRHAHLADALNTIYHQATGADAVQRNPDGKLRQLPSAAESMGLGSFYRTKDKR